MQRATWGHRVRAAEPRVQREPCPSRASPGPQQERTDHSLSAPPLAVRPGPQHHRCATSWRASGRPCESPLAGGSSVTVPGAPEHSAWKRTPPPTTPDMVTPPLSRPTRSSAGCRSPVPSSRPCPPPAFPPLVGVHGTPASGNTCVGIAAFPASRNINWLVTRRLGKQKRIEGVSTCSEPGSVPAFSQHAAS